MEFKAHEAWELTSPFVSWFSRERIALFAIIALFIRHHDWFFES